MFALFHNSLPEGPEIINPEGGTDDIEDEARRGRWKQDVCYYFTGIVIIELLSV